MCKERAIEGSSSLLRAFVWMSELFVQLVRRWRTLACESATALAFHSNVVSIALSLAVVHVCMHSLCTGHVHSLSLLVPP